MIQIDQVAAVDADETFIGELAQKFLQRGADLLDPLAGMKKRVMVLHLDVMEVAIRDSDQSIAILLDRDLLLLAPR